MSSLKRGRAIAKQAWYAVLRHRRGNPDTCYTVTYPYRCTLSTLPVDGIEPASNLARPGCNPPLSLESAKTFALKVGEALHETQSAKKSRSGLPTRTPSCQTAV